VVAGGQPTMRRRAGVGGQVAGLAGIDGRKVVERHRIVLRRVTRAGRRDSDRLCNASVTPGTIRLAQGSSERDRGRSVILQRGTGRCARRPTPKRSRPALDRRGAGVRTTGSTNELTAVRGASNRGSGCPLTFTSDAGAP